MINTDGEADIHVKWRGHDDEEELTWESLEQLVEDVSALVVKSSTCVSKLTSS